MLIKLGFKSKQQLPDNENNFKKFKGVAAGALSGLVTSAVTHPLDTIQANQQTGNSLASWKSFGSPNGLKYLYKGYPTKALRSIINMGIGFGAYDAFTKALDRKWNNK